MLYNSLQRKQILIDLLISLRYDFQKAQKATNHVEVSFSLHKSRIGLHIKGDSRCIGVQQTIYPSKQSRSIVSLQYQVGFLPESVISAVFRTQLDLQHLPINIEAGPN